MSQQLLCGYGHVCVYVCVCVHYSEANCLMALDEYSGLIMSIRVNGKSILVI